MVFSKKYALNLYIYHVNVKEEESCLKQLIHLMERIQVTKIS